MPSGNADKGLYFDHAAAVPVSSGVMDRLAVLFRDCFANQEAHGAHAVHSAEALHHAGLTILNLLTEKHAADHGLLWTMSGTEAVQAAFHVLQQNFPHGCDILYSDAEHASVTAAIRALPQVFHRIRIPLNEHGLMTKEAVSSAMNPDRDLVLCAPFVQSETGVMQDLVSLREVLAEHPRTAFLFCDGIQGIGKLPFPWQKIRPDLLTFSGQKFGCPAGGGVIAPAPLAPALKKVRSVFHAAGRLPAPFGILLAEQMEEMYRTMPQRIHAVRRTKAELLDRLRENLGDQFRTTLAPDEGSPYILHLQLGKVQGAIAVRYLRMQGISAASGSACDAETKEPSKMLTAMGIPRSRTFGGFRLSFFDPVPAEDLTKLAEALSCFFSGY